MAGTYLAPWEGNAFLGRAQGNAGGVPARLESTKPKQENFKTPEEFEEAHSYWMGRVGRILASLPRSTD